MSLDPTQRFTSRVSDYVRYRPTYPQEVFDLLVSAFDLGVGTRVADVGSGTGISTRGLLQTGATVFAVEPNAAMREAAEAEFNGEPRFRSVDGTAETTGLATGSVDAVVAFQAFHWFANESAKREFVRISQPPHRVALVWNTRDEDGTPFLRDYEALLREYATDYLEVRHNAVRPGEFGRFFGGSMRRAEVPNAQRFDLEGVTGRLLSSSYAPGPDDPRHGPMLDALRAIFDRHQEGGKVAFRYRTEVFYGTLG